VMLKDEKGQSLEGVMGHWDHPVGIVLLRGAGNWLVDGVCRESGCDGESHVMKMCVFL
jgi:hypothetical protein